MKRRTTTRVLAAVLFLCSTLFFAQCRTQSHVQTQNQVKEVSDKVWTYSQTHPDGFTLDIRTMTEPKEGICVAYAATQNSHSRDQLPFVVSHALSYDGFVGGWLNTADSLYYFDSDRIFPEDSLSAALRFARENGQISVFVISSYTEIVVDSTAKGLK